MSHLEQALQVSFVNEQILRSEFVKLDHFSAGCC